MVAFFAGLTKRSLGTLSVIFIEFLQSDFLHMPFLPAFLQMLAVKIQMIGVGLAARTDIDIRRGRRLPRCKHQVQQR